MWSEKTLIDVKINDTRSSPVDAKPEPNAAGLLPGDEVIDSDLDDSEGDLDDEDDGGDDADVDYVFCVYDKVSSRPVLVDAGWANCQVQRVKNKWKTVFKDGMIHINGKDYLFQKCNGYAVFWIGHCRLLTSIVNSSGRRTLRLI